MDSVQPPERALLAQLWHELGGAAELTDRVAFTGDERPLASVYHVSSLASASVAAASLAVAELEVVLSGEPMRAVSVDRVHAAVAFGCERYLEGVGWQLASVWDPIAGDYACRDGFIRLHTNCAHHRDAVLRVLGTRGDRDDVKQAVRRWYGETLESAVVAANGCAAFMHSPEQWRVHPQGRALLQAPMFEREQWPCEDVARPTRRAGLPLSGVRVLDLTRVIAGPVGTRFLAAYGADVLRIDPPGFEEVAVLLCDITAGKRRATLDLRASAGRARFEALLAEAHLLIHGYRSDALERLGFSAARLRELNPNLCIVTHNAYGFSGPWSTRRGFDSLVQMSCGIAWRGREALAAADPRPLPVQALDHATGYLIAASACRAWTTRLRTHQASLMRMSLARVARCLMELGEDGDPCAANISRDQIEPWVECVDTGFGRVRRVRCPGAIAGLDAAWTLPAGPLGCDVAQW